MKNKTLILLIFGLLTIIPSCKKDEGGLVLKRSFGKPGGQLGQFHFNSGNDSSWGLDHDGTYLYVTDRENFRIQRFDSNHLVKDWWGAKDSVWGFHTENIPADELFTPTKLVVKNDYMLIAGYLEEEFKSVVLKISSSGNILATFDIGVYGYSSMCIDSKDNIFVYEDNEIVKYDSQGNYLLTFGGEGTQDGKFNTDGITIQIAVDNNDNIYLPDPHNNRIQKFDNNGEFILKWESDRQLSGVAPLTYHDGKIYFAIYDYLVGYNLTGEEVNKWEDDEDYEFSAFQQILIVNNEIYQPNVNDQKIKIFGFEK
jgi:hypothetical protein